MDIIDLGSVQLFQTVLVPVLLINGVGLFILVLQTRYGRIVDRMRTLNNERRNLIKNDIFGYTPENEKKWHEHRLSHINEQITILTKRGKLLKDAIKYMFIAIFSSILSSFLLLVEVLTKIRVSVAVLLLLIFSMVMLFIAAVNGIKEVTTSYTAVMFDTETYGPEEYTSIK